MHCPSLRGTSEAEGVIVNVIVNVIVKKSTCMYRAWCMHVLFWVQGCTVIELLFEIYNDIVKKFIRDTWHITFVINI